MDPNVAASTSHSSTPPSPSERWVALDMLRFLAVVMMVQGHTFSALLGADLRRQRWYAYHDYVHGFTAPLFFVSSGIAFGVATLRHWQRFTQWSPAVKRRLERYGWLLFIGYALNLPQLSVPRLLAAKGPDDLLQFLKVDALHLIAVSLILAQLLVVRVADRRRFVIFIASIAAAVVLLAPVVWRWPVERWLPTLFAGYFNANNGALFPLPPWMGFVYAGIVAASLCVRPDGMHRRPQLAWTLGVSGLSLWFVGEALFRSRVNPFGEHYFWKTSPFFFLMRLGMVLTVFALLCLAEQLHGDAGRILHRPALASALASAPASAPTTRQRLSLLQLIGQESLIIYIVHLMVLYGSPMHRSLDQRWRQSLNLPQTLLVFVALFAGCVSVAMLWSRLRRRHPRGLRKFGYFLAIGLLIFAMFNPPS